MIHLGGREQDNHDQNYRYKRVQVKLSYEKTNGVTTKFMNIDAIAKQCHVKLDSICHYIQKKLSTPRILFTGVVPTVQGCLKEKQVDDIVELFIQNYVLCPSPTCRKPEWNTKTKRCDACGAVKKESKKKKIPLSLSTIDEDVTTTTTTTIIPDPDFDLEVAVIMHILYDIRIERKKDLKDQQSIIYLEEINQLLDDCWKLHDLEMKGTRSKWKKIRQQTKIMQQQQKEKKEDDKRSFADSYDDIPINDDFGIQPPNTNLKHGGVIVLYPLS